MQRALLSQRSLGEMKSIEAVCSSFRRSASIPRRLHRARLQLDRQGSDTRLAYLAHADHFPALRSLLLYDSLPRSDWDALLSFKNLRRLRLPYRPAKKEDDSERQLEAQVLHNNAASLVSLDLTQALLSRAHEDQLPLLPNLAHLRLADHHQAIYASLQPAQLRSLRKPRLNPESEDSFMLLSNNLVSLRCKQATLQFPTPPTSLRLLSLDLATEELPKAMSWLSQLTQLRCLHLCIRHDSCQRIPAFQLPSGLTRLKVQVWQRNPWVDGDRSVDGGGWKKVVEELNVWLSGLVGLRVLWVKLVRGLGAEEKVPLQLQLPCGLSHLRLQEDRCLLPSDAALLRLCNPSLRSLESLQVDSAETSRFLQLQSDQLPRLRWLSVNGSIAATPSDARRLCRASLVLDGMG